MTKNYVTLDLIYSSNLDGRHLISVDPQTGGISTVDDPVVTDAVVQTYEITFSSVTNFEVSKSVNITFKFGSCVIGLVGPSSAVVCAGYPPSTTPNPRGSLLETYPQLTFTATNVPTLMTLVWDAASDGTPAGQGAPCPGAAPTCTAAGQSFGINSPAVLSGDDPFVYVSNLNAPTLVNVPSTSPVGIYGAGNNGACPCSDAACTAIVPNLGTDPTTGEVTGSCCQTLLFSVQPGFAETPYQGSTKTVKVCYDDTSTCVPST